jgi:HAD superfamily hydrolase (TIGR01509 family)
MLKPEEPIQAVLFDFAGTLFVPKPATVQVREVANALGLALVESECERLAAEFLHVGMPGGPYPESVPHEVSLAYANRDLGPDEHRNAYMALMSTVSAPEEFATKLYDRILVADGWVPYSDALDTVQTLIDHKMPVGLVSNVGFDLRPILTAHGMQALAAHATLSFEHGVTKPSPEIFRLALASLRVEAPTTLMVGDHPEADGGAAALGMQTLILPMSPAGSQHGLNRILDLVRAPK